MKIFLINLKTSVERRKFMEKQLAKVGWDYELFEAVNGSELNQETLEKECDLTTAQPKGMLRSMGFIGCAMSHQRIYQRIAHEKISVSLILEDDITLSPDLLELMPKLLKELKDDEVILLYFVPGEKCAISTQNTTVLNKHYTLRYPMNNDIFSTAAYLIPLPVAEKMAQITTPIRYFADEWAAFYKQGAFRAIRCVLPLPILPSFSKSDIGYTDGVNSKIVQLRDWIEDNNIFPLSWLLRLKRQIQWKKRQETTRFTDDVSPFANS